MTRHYTHLGELAAIDTVALLPNVTSLPDQSAPVKLTSMEIIREAHKMVESLTTKNLPKVRGKLLAILGTALSPQATQGR